MKNRSLKKSLMSLAISAALLTGANVALAGGEDPGAWTVGGGGLWLMPDSDRNLDDGGGFNVWVGKVINEQWDVNLSYFNTTHDIRGSSGGDLSLEGIGFDADRVFNRSSRVSPFLTLGAGYQFQDSDAGLDDDGFVKVGAGVLGDIATFSSGSVLQLKASAGLRYQIGTFNFEPVFGLGLQYGWGGRAPAAPVAAVAAVAAAPAAARPLDTDGDGVVDNLDRCPNTPRGDRVGPNGCSCDVSIQLTFEFDSATLTAADKAELDRVAVRLQELQFVGGEAGGHTDSTGDDAYNLDLSKRRAQAAVDYLATKGVSSARITVAGYGETAPVADNATADGRAKNRRVVLRRTDCGPR
jgi:OmpA-OmpF porin, OOP family